jgi:nitrite reductase/ring-hydroxylating ferredoxin subunit
MPTTTISTSAQRTTRRASARRGRTRADALRDTGVTREGLRAAEKRRVVVELDGLGKVLIQEFAGDVYAVSNKCPHLGLSLQGKTPLLSATVEDGAIVCPAHGSAFDLKTGAAKGEWCPKLPALPVVGKKYCGEPTAIASYAVSVDESGAIKIDA